MSDQSSESPSNPSQEPPSHIDATDAQGRRVRIPREEYRSKVLPQMLKAHENDADRLAAAIMQAVQYGFADDVIAAANRLTVIDKHNLERALSVLAVVQRDAGELELAESTLNELRQRQPESVAALVGLGLVRDRQGDVAGSEQLLWQALERDCNHPDAVHAYLQLRHRAVGDAGYRQEIEKVMALPGSWRAQLWLARLLLNGAGDDADVESIYRGVFDAAGDDVGVASDALLMAAGDLVQHGRRGLVDALVAPRFRPGEQHPHIGLALLHHYHGQQRHQEGEQLLHQMHVHYGHLVAQELQPYSAEFDRMRLAQLPPPPSAEAAAQAQIQIVRLDRPAWYAGFDDPAWLLPDKASGHKHVMVFALAIDGQPQLTPEQQEEIGRTTRATSLWLAEQLWLGSPHRGTAALSTAGKNGWAVLGRPWPEQQLAAQIPAAERDDTLLVTGQLRIDGERRVIELWVYDCASGQRVGTVTAAGAHAEQGRLLLELMAGMWPLLGGPDGHAPQVGEPGFWHRYADGLSQHAALVLTDSGALPRERLYGERYVTQWLQAAALAETRWQPGFWLLGSALCTLQRLGSKVPLEHARLWAEVFRQSPPNSPTARLGAKILPACGLLPLWQGRREEIHRAAAGEPAVKAWLERVDGAN